ncbi:MAG: hypothetical protein P4L40_03910, partial [Terracidiphilus sp.]|nr:hypothetical protein [Terracidiphilus sp.]
MSHSQLADLPFHGRPGRSLASCVLADPSTQVWRYTTNAQAASWASIGYDDSGWQIGSGTFGPTGSVLSAAPGAPWYFRANVTGTYDVTGIPLRFNIQDADGYVIYLNGAEVVRGNMPSGAVTYTTLASSTVTSPCWAELSGYATSASLVTGTNVIAVEVHQASTHSAHAAFAFSALVMSDGCSNDAVYHPGPSCDGSDHESDQEASMTPTPSCIAVSGSATPSVSSSLSLSAS